MNKPKLTHKHKIFFGLSQSILKDYPFMANMQLKKNISLYIFLFIFLASTGCNNHYKSSQDISITLLELERKALEREFKNDTSFLSSIMDSTFMELSKSDLKNKHEVLQTIFKDNLQNEKNKLVRDSFQLQEPVVNSYGDAAVVTFILKTFNKKNDSSFTKHTRFYDVWIKRGDEWKAITWQGSPLDY